MAQALITKVQRVIDVGGDRANLSGAVLIPPPLYLQWRRGNRSCFYEMWMPVSRSLCITVLIYVRFMQH